MVVVGYFIIDLEFSSYALVFQIRPADHAVRKHACKTIRHDLDVRFLFVIIKE